jgi:hypothetical protein
MSSNTQKLRVLRLRTDQDLQVLVQRELDRGLYLLNAATTSNSPLFAQAGNALATATVLLPRIGGLSQDDRLRMEEKLRELRKRLDQVPVYPDVRPFTISVAS